MDPSTTARYIEDIKARFPGFEVESAGFEGEGDFCRAYTVNGQWIFRFAYNEEGSKALRREAALLPALAPLLSLPIPAITFYGDAQDSGLAFVGYPRIEGEPLTRGRLETLETRQQDDFIRQLAGFLSELHAFDLETARQASVPECEYPFCRTERGVTQGAAAEIYTRELEHLLTYPSLDEGSRSYCKDLVERILDERQEGELPAAVVHGDLSAEHILGDTATGRIAGIIDFSDVVITSPLLDFVYLYQAYGQEMLRRLLSHYPAAADKDAVERRVRLLHAWYTVIRLLWSLDHDYRPGIEQRLRDLDILRGTSANQ